MPMTREQHLDWCKKRALEYVDKGDLVNGVTSMISDMNKHDETRMDPGGALGMLSMLALSARRAAEIGARFVVLAAQRRIGSRLDRQSDAGSVTASSFIGSRLSCTSPHRTIL